MVARKWTADQLEQLTPAEQDEVFAAAVVSDLDDVPPEFLARVRARVERRIQAAEATDPH